MMFYALIAKDYPDDESEADTGHLIAVLEEVANTLDAFRLDPDWVHPDDKPRTIEAMLEGVSSALTDSPDGVPVAEYRDMLVEIAATSVAAIMIWDRQKQPGESGEVVAAKCPIAAVGGKGCEQPDCTCHDHALEGGAQ